MSKATDWDEHTALHVSPQGRTHTGRRQGCVSLDCTPPSIDARHGDLIHVVLPDGTQHDWRIECDYPGRIVFSVPS